MFEKDRTGEWEMVPFEDWTEPSIPPAIEPDPVPLMSGRRGCWMRRFCLWLRIGGAARLKPQSRSEGTENPVLFAGCVIPSEILGSGIIRKSNNGVCHVNVADEQIAQPEI